MPLETIRLNSETLTIPKQGLLDYLTRMDELLVANLKAIKNLEMVTNLVLPAVKRKSSVEMRRELELGQYIPYEVRAFAMDSARADEKIEIEGDQLTAQVSTGGTLSGVKIRFNMPTADQVPMDMFNPWKQQFYTIYLTHTAQSGKTLYLAIGREAAAETIGYSISAEFLNKVTLLDSTTDNLNASATYTSSQFTVDAYARIIGTLLMTQNGTLYVDQSSDGTNYDFVESTSYTANDTLGFSVEVVAPYARVRLTNTGGSATTTLRLYTSARRV